MFIPSKQRGSTAVSQYHYMGEKHSTIICLCLEE